MLGGGSSDGPAWESAATVTGWDNSSSAAKAGLAAGRTVAMIAGLPEALLSEVDGCSIAGFADAKAVSGSGGGDDDNEEEEEDEEEEEEEEEEESNVAALFPRRGASVNGTSRVVIPLAPSVASANKTPWCAAAEPAAGSVFADAAAFANTELSTVGSSTKRSGEGGEGG